MIQYKLYAGMAACVLMIACVAVALSQPRKTDHGNAALPNHARPKTFPTIIRQPSGAPRVQLGIKDKDGNQLTAACSTCHSRRTPNKQTRAAVDLDEFHQGLKVSHGQLSCLSCHNSDDYDTLRHVDGRAIRFRNVIDLCGQCHGRQLRDYNHGAHGGSSGYWDLSRGPRRKNNCVDCHDPHAPQFPAMKPTFKPRDRFLRQSPQHD